MVMNSAATRHWLPLHPTKLLLAAVLLIWQAAHFTSHAMILKCPLYQMHLQKIVGVRPPLDYINEHSLIYAPSNRFEDGSRYTSGTYDHRQTYRNENDNYERSQRPIPLTSTICWRICNADEECIAYVHLLDTNECYGYTYLERSQRYGTIRTELSLEADAEAIYYEKTCLKVPITCKARPWTLTKIPGSSLMFQGKKTIATLVTRRECAESCLFENDFKCLSASFAPSYRNNRERFSQLGPSNEHITFGRCILSDKDKMIQPDGFRAAPYDEEYIENQCHERAVESEQCSYEIYSDSTFIYGEIKYIGLTHKECQTYCTRETTFYCQGVSYYFENYLATSECLLHTEDIISMGPRSLKYRKNSVYMRRVKCLDVQVLCTHEEMAIKYTPKDTFTGKMYVSLHSKSCAVQGSGTLSTLLRLPIGTEIVESRCGIIRAYEVTTEYQRSFISALIVIQNNLNVQTQGDRLIKVGCIMSNTTMKSSLAIDMPSNVAGEEVPNAIALESSLEFAQQALPHQGSLHYNTTESQNLPKITLQIIDLSHQHETNDVQIGQNLELQIIAAYDAPPKELAETTELPPLPDFRATSLVAKTEDNQNYVLLIDERGCPTDDAVFPALERVRTKYRNILRARFHAFKFAGTSMVNFDVRIHFCKQNCPEHNCWPYGESKKDWHSTRKRRQVAFDPQLSVKVQNPVYISTVMDVSNDTNTFNLPRNVTSSDDYLHNMELPLNYNLHVRGPDNTNSNSFIYGERGVLLIAGIDGQFHTETICVNQSLLIALFIFWLIFQVALMFGCCYVIQKYKSLTNLDEERRKIHESLEYLEGRRVHWADQGGFTL